MILANYWRWMNMALADIGNVSETAKNYGIRSAGGQYLSDLKLVADAAHREAFWKGVQSRTFDGVLLGTGTGTIQNTDYALFSDATNEFTNVNFTIDNTYENIGFQTTVIITGQYLNHAVPITIREVGLHKHFVTTSDAAWESPVLMVKILLDEPVVVQPGASFRIAVEWIQS